MAPLTGWEVGDEVDPAEIANVFPPLMVIMLLFENKTTAWDEEAVLIWSPSKRGVPHSAFSKLEDPDRASSTVPLTSVSNATRLLCAVVVDATKSRKTKKRAMRWEEMTIVRQVLWVGRLMKIQHCARQVGNVSLPISCNEDLRSFYPCHTPCPLALSRWAR